MKELFVRRGPVGQERPLLDQMDLQLVVIQRDVIPEVTVKPARLFCSDRGYFD